MQFSFVGITDHQFSSQMLLFCGQLFKLSCHWSYE